MKKVNASLIMAIIFTITAFVGITFAWINFNESVYSQGNNMNLEFLDVEATYEVYKYDIDTELGVKTDKDGNLLSIADITFNQYDLIFISRNRYTPIFARIQIEKSDSMLSSGHISITISRNLSINKDHVISDYSSSVIRFSGYICNLYDEDPNILYQDISQTIGSLVDNNSSDEKFSSNVFVSKDESSNYIKENNIYLSMKYNPDDFVTVDNKEVLNIYLYMTYDDTLINYYKDENDMNDITFGNNVVEFANDLKTIKIGYNGD